MAGREGGLPVGDDEVDRDRDRPGAPGAVHRPVLLDEVMSGLAPRPGAVIVDGTAGAGGHTAALARAVGPTGRVIGLDRDPAMLALAREATRGQDHVTILHAAYDEMGDVLEEIGLLGLVDGVILDLGLSSDQLAWSERGFSFDRDGPLDMRFDTQSDGPTAADLVNRLPETELADLIYQFGEERLSRRIARRIVATRQAGAIRTTADLADLVRRCVPRRPGGGGIDPATRVFQALRIAVNDELGRLDRVLEGLPRWLKPGGRAAIISFHSLEDRRVKWSFRRPEVWTIVTKKPITAGDDETGINPRARSAKLRVAERWTSST
jgi:16S rRNA (cytosine1402-N4)-methyltransferase